MFAKRDLYEVSLCWICLGLANGSVTVTPSNTAVVAGSWMSMECRTANGSTVYRWTLTRPTNSSKEYLFKNYNGGQRLSSNYSYGVDVDEHGSGLLYLNATQLDDAGLYTCYTFVDDEQLQNSAELIVLESEPLCETNYTAEDNVTLIEGDIIRMQCTVNFRGMWAPTVEWKQHTTDDKGEEEEEQIVLQGVSTVTLLNTSITTTLIHVADFSKTTHFSCRMFFQWHNGSVQATATNPPTYNYTWTSPRLVPHWAQLKTTEEVYVAPLPVEVGPVRTTTPKPSGDNSWYIISLILLFAVLVFVSLLVGLGIRRYVRSRRARDVNMAYNASTSSTVPLRRLERPSSIEYDIVPTATPNIYERIDGADADDDVAEQATTSHNNHTPLTQCYSGLMVATGNATSQYDTLDQYAKMDQCNPETEDPAARKTPECPSQETQEERYTTPVPKRGVATANLPTGSSDYLQMVGNVKDSKVGVKPLYVAVPNDSDEDNDTDGKLKEFAKDSDDYLQPSPKAVDNCPTYLQIV